MDMGAFQQESSIWDPVYIQGKTRIPLLEQDFIQYTSPLKFHYVEEPVQAFIADEEIHAIIIEMIDVE
jgi:hypothetical protein